MSDGDKCATCGQTFTHCTRWQTPHAFVPEGRAVSASRQKDLERAFGLHVKSAANISRLMAEVRAEERERCMRLYELAHGADNVFDAIASGAEELEGEP